MDQQTTPAPPPQQIVMQMATGKWVSKALSVVADLAIPDLLKDGPRPVDELARECGAHPDALYRLLRGVSAVGVLDELPGRSFRNNALSETLRSDVPGSMRAMVRFLGEDSTWRAWGGLKYAVETGMPAFDHVIGQHVFEHFKAHPEASRIFNDAMVNLTAVTGNAVVDAYDFSVFKKIVDVGGGHGALLATIAGRYPGVHGVVADLPEVMAGAREFIASQGLTNRIDAAAADFFESVPAGADGYVMKHIIHDWDDARSMKILSNCAQAMDPRGKVLVIDQVVSDDPAAVFSKLIDLEMLVMTGGGRERTEQEFRNLLQRSGLKMTRIVRTASFDAIVEAVKA